MCVSTCNCALVPQVVEVNQPASAGLPLDISPCMSPAPWVRGHCTKMRMMFALFISGFVVIIMFQSFVLIEGENVAATRMVDRGGALMPNMPSVGHV